MSIQVGARSLTLAQATRILTTHLKAIVEVELFTIPVYLTAVYSFSEKGLSYVDPHPGSGGDVRPLYSLQQKALSVAVQEMLHLQLACNLVNALGETPDIPNLSLHSGPITIPHLKTAGGSSQTMSLGNLPEAIGSFIDIEAPDPDHTFPPPNDKAEYTSISDLYYATLELLGLVAQAAYEANAPIFDGGHQVVYGTFPSTYPQIPMKIESPDTAVTAANAIADQGEGQLLTEQNAALAAQRLALYVFGRKGENSDGNVAPQFRPELASRFGQWGNWAHYDRFKQIKATLESPRFKKWDDAVRAEYAALEHHRQFDIGAFYVHAGGATIWSDLPQDPAPTPTLKQLTNSNELTWEWITRQLRSGFKDGTLNPSYSTDPAAPSFTEAMLSFKYVLPMIWCYRQAPTFTPRPLATGAEVQTAMDIIDPYCLFHWDAKTRELRSHHGFQQNACHGLNSCSNRGWGGFGTRPGDGACSTAAPHTCGGNNDCRDRGGCGFLVGPSGEACSTARKQKQTTHATRVLRGAAAPLGGGCVPMATPCLLPPSEEWVPGMNSCALRGGCETPISTRQVFSSAGVPIIDAQDAVDGWTEKAKKEVGARAGTPVWDYARTLLKNKYQEIGEPQQSQHIKDSPVIYDGKARRTLIQPTSPS
ncbi:MAG TPA: ferritin-like domain-containing protein [Thermoanaerobaculia bacterium]